MGELPEELKELINVLRSQQLQDEMLDFKIHTEEQSVQICLAIVNTALNYKKDPIKVAKQFWKVHEFFRKQKIQEKDDKRNN